MKIMSGTFARDTAPEPDSRFWRMNTAFFRHMCGGSLPEGLGHMSNEITLEEALRLIRAQAEEITKLREGLARMITGCDGGLVPGGDGETRFVHPPSNSALKIARAALGEPS